MARKIIFNPLSGTFDYIDESNGGGGGGGDGDMTKAVYDPANGERQVAFSDEIPQEYTSADFDTDFAGKSTTDLSEGTNLYYTEARVSANTDVAANTAKRSYPEADEDKLAGIEAGAEVNQNDAEIKTQYEANADTNAYTDAEKSKLDGIESGAEVNTVNPADIANFETTTELNARDTANRNRANHTGTQTMSTISDAGELATQDDNDILAKVYPVGSLYMNRTNSTNPATLLGFGTWTQIQDKMIMARGSTYTADGGSATHTHGLSDGHALLVAQDDRVRSQEKDVSSWTQNTNVEPVNIAGASTSRTRATALGGNTDSSSNIPPMVVAYIWERVA